MSQYLVSIQAELILLDAELFLLDGQYECQRTLNFETRRNIGELTSINFIYIYNLLVEVPVLHPGHYYIKICNT